MTTKITVDAHAGWPVLVAIKHGEANYPKSISVETVAPNTVKDFYIHSGMELISISENKRDD